MRPLARLLALVLWPLTRLLQFASTARNVLGLRVSPVRVEMVPAADLPPACRELFQPDLTELTALGFPAAGALKVWDIFLPDLARFQVGCLNDDGTIRVSLARHPSQLLNPCAQIVVSSTLDNGEEVQTASHESLRLVPSAPQVKREIVEWARFPALLARHRERLAAARVRGAHLVPLTPEGALERTRLLTTAAIDAFAHSGQAAADGQGRLHWRFWPGLAKTWGILRQSRRQARATQVLLRSGTLKPPTPTLTDTARLQLDWEAYQAVARVRRGQMSGQAKALVMLGSLVLFCLAYGLRMSPGAVAMLVGVLVFHEGGHLLGMRLFGFRDTQLLFLPFLGGVAVGRDAVILRPWQRLVMLFLGPLPGLFIGFGLLAFWTSAPAWVRELASFLIFLNAFNLLPFLPLDGGQVVDTVFVGRFPFIKVVFLAASAVALILVSLSLPAATLLGVLGALMLVLVRSEWRNAALLRRLRRELPAGADEETTVRRVLVELRQPSWSQVPMNQRLILAGALQARLRQPRPDWRALALGIALYTSPVWGCLGLFQVAARWPAHPAPAAAAPPAGPADPTAGTTASGPAPAWPPDQDAAIPLAAAVALIPEGRPEDEDADAGAALTEVDSANTAKALALLHDAAQRPGFAPAGPPATDLGLAVNFLAQQADGLQRLHDGNRALALCLDGLRLDRLFQTDPAEWSTLSHFSQTSELWNVVEQVLANGLDADPRLLAQINEQLDPASLIKYSCAALLDQVEAQRKRAAGRKPGAGLPRYMAEASMFQRALFWVFSLGTPPSDPQGAAERARAWLGPILRGIAAGRWPSEAELETRAAAGQTFPIILLGKDVARAGMANTALAVSWQWRTTGRRPQAFAEIACPWWRGVPRDPLTGRLLQWRQVHGVGVLSYPADPGLRHADEEEYGGTATWRLPTGK